MNADKKIFNFTLNWSAVLAFVAFWSYGYYGIITAQGIILKFFLTVITGGIFGFFLIWAFKPRVPKSRFTITVRHVSVFFVFFIALLPLAWQFLRDSLAQDQIYHAQYSQLHGIFFLQKFVHLFPSLQAVSFRLLLYFFNLNFLIFSLLGFLMVKKLPKKYQIILYITLFLAIRFLVIHLGGITDPHPPFRLFPLWIFASILSPSALVFRLVEFVGLIIFLVLLYGYVSAKTSTRFAFLPVFAIGAIPLLLHIGTMAEQSIWTSIIWTLLLVDIHEKGRDINFFNWFGLIAVFSLMRQSVFVALVPLGILYLFRLVKEKTPINGTNLKNIFLMVSPVLILLPFLAKSLIVGTPATYVSAEPNIFGVHGTAILRIWFAIRSGIAWHSIANAIFLSWLVFFPFAFINKGKFIQPVSTVIFFLAGFGTFYSIRPALWGMGRYQAEYVLPFAIAGFIFLILWLYQKFFSAAIAISLALIIVNGYSLVYFPDLIKPVDAVDQGNFTQIPVWSEFVYNYPLALQSARAQGYANSAYLVGVTYGVFPQILQNYSVKDVLAENSIYKNLSGSQDPQKIASDKNVKLVLVGDVNVGRKQELIVNLKNLGFRDWRNFYDERYESTVVGLVR